MGQLSFYSAEARQPCVGDLAGLLCGPGQALGFARGRAARVSVGVDTRDRAAAVLAVLAERGVQARVELVRVAPAQDEPAGEPPAAEVAHDLVAEVEAEPPDEPVEPADDESDGFQPVVIGSGRSGPAAPEPDPTEPDPTEPDPTEPDLAEPDPTEPDLVAPDQAEADPTEAETRVEPEAEAEAEAEPEVGPEAGPEAGAEPEVTESWQVMTPFRADLAGLAGQWFDGCRKVVPPDFTLDGGALRLWALAAGRWVESGSGYLLGLDPTAPDTHETLRKALATSGLPSTLLSDGAGGPALRVVGRRRLERLAELVGRAPRGVAERTWPAA
ncbi:hypothetical protein [Saccharothrix sp. HUAS TT1]|uniref:hypothetical protein n=1 Tax=unclassified Saccharothrix TaxID=2593673 RepID=UPI00345BFF48